MIHREAHKNISGEKASVLLELARKTIAERLGLPYESPHDLEEKLKDETFDANHGIFVTLKINNQLRGCIGNLRPDQSIRDGVRDHAVNAALNDPRFPPLTRDELESVQLEISILTEPLKLEYKGGDDLLARLIPRVDGVLIRKGIHSSTFLPQVWDQLPDKKDFLRHLCLKAGLPMDEWKKGELLVYTYRVQDFED
jgi:AmmeMemoRadiSam system protein A